MNRIIKPKGESVWKIQEDRNQMMNKSEKKKIEPKESILKSS